MGTTFLLIKFAVNIKPRVKTLQLFQLIYLISISILRNEHVTRDFIKNFLSYFSTIRL